jgi:hypothetical protein
MTNKPRQSEWKIRIACVPIPGNSHARNTLDGHEIFSILALSILCSIGMLMLQDCAGEPTPSQVGPVQFSLTTRDLPESKTFEVSLQSLDDRAICLFSEEWPGPLGQVHEGARFVSIVHEGGRLPIENLNLGFCYGGCGTVRVEPRGLIRAHIPYSEFGSVDEIASLRGKRLDYRPTVLSCSEFEESPKK